MRGGGWVCGAKDSRGDRPRARETEAPHRGYARIFPRSSRLSLSRSQGRSARALVRSNRYGTRKRAKANIKFTAIPKGSRIPRPFRRRRWRAGGGVRSGGGGSREVRGGGSPREGGEGTLSDNCQSTHALVRVTVFPPVPTVQGYFALEESEGERAEQMS